MPSRGIIITVERKKEKNLLRILKLSVPFWFLLYLNLSSSKVTFALLFVNRVNFFKMSPEVIQYRYWGVLSSNGFTGYLFDTMHMIRGC